MDPHFNEYLAAVVGMHGIYGERADEQPTEFHTEQPSAAPATEPTVAVA